MKEIEIIINGDKLDRVKRILSGFSDNGIFVTQGFGYGHQHGFHQVYTRDDSRGVNLLPKVSVRTVVADDLVDPIVDEAVASMNNATFGDGKIFIRPIEDAIRVRTDERGDEAL
ncbi:nitrogen regulatory protein P-II [Denitrobacterium detoxificans]|uniref:Nitrogen regulatory protein P-II family n=1 Tax=Denitrobacterium detoxificans TaxID=79604 RepID=A0A172RZH6_9ACTN|nr:P-II family nitrogen regulator [Denitrobacterium detoxificans]ANE23013.1 nitrogen regulatory protein P-II [Denitrobacterium detoxificans]SEO75139.1 nitrogen regulatory protein P-II family [Denitrobacterium detoxificans]